MTTGAKPLGPAGMPVIHQNGVPTTEFGAWLDYINRLFSSGSLSVENGGTGDTGTAWASYTPIITSAGGVATTVSATGRFKQIGKTVFCEIDVNIVNKGTATFNVIATLPVAAAAHVYAGSAYEYNVTGKSGAAVILASDATHVYMNDASGGSWWVNGYKLGVTIIYEAA
jgi:hypothetical protein